MAGEGRRQPAGGRRSNQPVDRHACIDQSLYRAPSTNPMVRRRVHLAGSRRWLVSDLRNPPVERGQSQAFGSLPKDFGSQERTGVIFVRRAMAWTFGLVTSGFNGRSPEADHLLSTRFRRLGSGGDYYRDQGGWNRRLASLSLRMAGNLARNGKCVARFG